MARVDFGAPAPQFEIRTHVNPRFVIGSVAGRFLLLAFLPADRASAEAIAARLVGDPGFFRLDHRVAFLITEDEALFAAQTDLPGVRWGHDIGGAVGRLYGTPDAEGREAPHWVVLDPSLRVVWTGDWGEIDRLMASLARVPAPDQHAGTVLSAPVLIVPRIFEAGVCRRLIEFYEARGGSPSGVMRQIGGRTVPVLDDFKKRRDAEIDDERLQQGTRWRIHDRLLPEIKKAFQFTVTRIERFIVAAYDAEEGGYFRPHRDDTTTGTAHRRFACSINLNGDFEGGDLRFPEFGTRTYRPPPGGAVVFSCSLLHEATPVTKGRRYAFLPFFYDEAAAAIRDANRASVLTASADDAA